VAILGLKEQQIHRYEPTRYAGVRVERVQAILDALGVRIRGRLVLPMPAASRSSVELRRA